MWAVTFVTVTQTCVNGPIGPELFWQTGGSDKLVVTVPPELFVEEEPLQPSIQHTAVNAPRIPIARKKARVREVIMIDLHVKFVTRRKGFPTPDLNIIAESLVRLEGSPTAMRGRPQWFYAPRDC